MNQQNRRAITAADLRVWRDFIETSESLRSRLDSRLQNDSSLSAGDYGVLLALSEADERSMRSSDLADAVGWERSRLSHHLRRMEARELIERNPCADDTRGSRISLTESGSSAFRRGSVPHLRAIQELFLDALSSEQLAHVDSVTASLRHHLGLPERTPE